MVYQAGVGDGDCDGDNDRRFGVYANGILVEVPSNNMMDGALNIKPLDF
jgi:hypothetical protein